jgi:hypothetical protein
LTDLASIEIEEIAEGLAFFPEQPAQDGEAPEIRQGTVDHPPGGSSAPRIRATSQAETGSHQCLRQEGEGTAHDQRQPWARSWHASWINVPY